MGLTREKLAPGASDQDVAVKASWRSSEKDAPQRTCGGQRLLAVGLRHPWRHSVLHSGIDHPSQGCSSVMWPRMTASLYEGRVAYRPYWSEQFSCHEGYHALGPGEPVKRVHAWEGPGTDLQGLYHNEALGR
jgi:hypothetical protein